MHLLHFSSKTLLYWSLFFGPCLCAVTARDDPQFLTDVERVTTVQLNTFIYSLEHPDHSSSDSSSTTITKIGQQLTQNGNSTITTTVLVPERGTVRTSTSSTNIAATFTPSQSSYVLSSSTTPAQDNVSTVTVTDTSHGPISSWIGAPSSLSSFLLPTSSSTSTSLLSANISSPSKMTAFFTNEKTLSTTSTTLSLSTLPLSSTPTSTSSSSTSFPSFAALNLTSNSTRTFSSMSGSSSKMASMASPPSNGTSSTSSEGFLALSGSVTTTRSLSDSTRGSLASTTLLSSGKSAMNLSTSTTLLSSNKSIMNLSTSTISNGRGSPIKSSSSSIQTSSNNSSASSPASHGPIVAPPKYGAGNWSSNKCSVKLTGNTGYTNQQMWAAADADGTWDYISKLPYDGSINWSSFVARELNFSSWQEYQCQILSADNDCMYQQDCASPLTPGGWMVVNSIANLWGYHWDMYNLIQTAHAQLEPNLVVNNFSPQFDEGAYLQHEIWLTGLTFGIMMGIGALFSFGAEFLVAGIDIVATAAEAATLAANEAKFVGEGLSQTAAAAKAATLVKSPTTKKLEEAGLTSTILISHDLLAGGAMYAILTSRYALGTTEDGLVAENILTDLTANFTNRWQSSEASFIAQLFNGSKNSIANVGSAIANGTWLTPWNETSSKTNFTSTAVPLLVKHLYGMMIPYAWAAATKSKIPYMPVVIMAEGCLANITDLIPKTGQFMGEAPMQFDDHVDDRRLCFEGRTFWLLTPYKTGHNNAMLSPNPGVITGGDAVRFQLLPGLEMLNGDSQTYGGITGDDMIISSYYGWTNNSYMNPTDKPDPGSVLTQEAWAQSVRYPGFFNFPVCNGLPGILAAAQSFWDGKYAVPC